MSEYVSGACSGLPAGHYWTIIEHLWLAITGISCCVCGTAGYSSNSACF